MDALSFKLFALMHSMYQYWCTKWNIYWNANTENWQFSNFIDTHGIHAWNVKKL